MGERDAYSPLASSVGIRIIIDDNNYYLPHCSQYIEHDTAVIGRDLPELTSRTKVAFSVDGLFIYSVIQLSTPDWFSCGTAPPHGRRCLGSLKGVRLPGILVLGNLT